MEVLVMRSSNKLHSQELFPSKKDSGSVPGFFFFLYDVFINTTLILPSEKNDMINKHFTTLRDEINGCFPPF